MENLREGKKQYLKNKTKDLVIQKLLNDELIQNLVRCHRLHYCQNMEIFLVFHANIGGFSTQKVAAK